MIVNMVTRDSKLSRLQFASLGFSSPLRIHVRMEALPTAAIAMAVSFS
jgi:hypothetical protein